jgi:hypothetical protein
LPRCGLPSMSATAAGVADGNVFARVRESLNLPTTLR